MRVAVTLVSFVLALTLPCYSDQVCSVRDGDTFRLCDGQRIRVWGIDAPELKQPYGYSARDFLREIVMNKDVQLDCVSRHYKRKVCHVALGDIDISSAMVSAGYAYDYRLYTKGRYQAEEEEARLTRKGLWQADLPVEPWIYRHNTRRKR